jgi:quercetin dioxygenase-like cupin family protein
MPLRTPAARTTVAGLSLTIFCGIGIAAQNASPSTSSTSSKTPIVVPYGGASFKSLNPSVPNSTEIAVLRGDPDKGPSTMLMKMRKMAGRMHVHTADYELVVIEGTMTHWKRGEDGATAKPLGVGSYWFQPGGEPHADSCVTDTCVMYITWSGPRDARLAEGQP